MSSAFAIVARATLLAAALASCAQSLSAQCGIDTNYGTNLQLADDQVSAQLPLGFAFPFAGATYDAVYVSSNGFLYLFDTNGSVSPPTDARCCTGNPFALVNSPSPMVCAFWTDLNPPAGGGVFFNTAPGKAFASFVSVPEFVSQGTTNTFQIVLYATGQIDLLHDSNCSNNSPVLAGWSPGAGATNPGSRDFTAVPFTTTSATAYELFQASTLDLAGRATRATPASATSWGVDAPAGCAMSWAYGLGCRAAPGLRLSAAPGSRPVINTTFNLSVQNVTATTASGVLVIGVTNPNLNLAFLGLPFNCVLLASLDVLLSFPASTPTTTVPVPVPNSTALVGRTLNTQAIMVDPPLGGLPLALTNGLRLLFGL